MNFIKFTTCWTCIGALKKNSPIGSLVCGQNRLLLWFSKYIVSSHGMYSTISFVSFNNFTLFLNYYVLSHLIIVCILGIVIFLDGILMLTRTALSSEHMSNPLEFGVTWETYAFISCNTILYVFYVIQLA